MTLKACSFLPAATRMIYDMGLQHLLFGVTFECPTEALKEKPKLVRCVLEGKKYSSAEIDKIFSASKAEGKSLYYIDEEVPLKRISLLEWIEPIYNCGHWIPFQIAQAGAIDMLSDPAGDSIITSFEKIIKYDPEVLVIAPCGFEIERTKQEMNLLTKKPGWNEMRAVRTKQVYLADYDLFTQPSASTLVDGIELLAALFHPELFRVPSRLSKKYLPF